MFTEIRNNNATHSYVWIFKDTPDKKYTLSIRACGNPFCPCENFALHFYDGENNDPVAILAVDLKKETVNGDNLSQHTNNLSDRIISEISSDDWKVLSDLFYFAKKGSLKNADLKSYNLPSFPIWDIEESSVMIFYDDIIPWARDPYFTISNITYLVKDQYCLNSQCKCEDVAIQFIMSCGEKQIHKDTPCSIRFYYKTGKWEKIDDFHDKDVSLDKIVSEMLVKYPNIGDILKERKLKLKEIYQLYKEQYLSKKSGENNKGKKMGRNVPCSCGSGKKYKKCCGK